MITFKNVRIIDPESNRDSLGSLTIDNGIIEKIDGPIKGESIDCKGACLAPGIVDIGPKICEPGERHKESFRTASAAAAAGGVTCLVTRPDTSPPIDTPEILEFFLTRASNSANVKILPMVTMSKNLSGSEMSELGFMKDLGAIAFSEGLNYFHDTKYFQKTMQYIKALDLFIIGHPQENSLSEGSVATAGAFASKLGLPSVSTVAEKIGLERDLCLASLTEVKYHADQITTEDAVETLKRYKKTNDRISAGTSIHHISLNELDIGPYRTFFKITPPLRSEKDRLAVINGLKDGTIDIIGSFHTPQDEESKRLPYETAAPGAIGLETILCSALRLTKDKIFNLPTLFKFLSLNPANLIGAPFGRIREGSPADLVVFDPDEPFLIDRFKLKSKSKNTPFDEQTMQGRVLMTYVNGEEVFRRYN